MKGITPELILLVIAVMGIVALLVGVLAYICAKRRAPASFIVCVALLWGGIGWWFGHQSAISTFNLGRIVEWRQIADILLTTAPLAFVPAIFALQPVLGRVPIGLIPARVSLGVIVAIPFAILAGLASSCFVVSTCA
jgi:hypothetical protein